ncbi:hypothetical protein PAXINDRAFT_158549 [Paxillus involutus ATCC 200175]|uniref:Uncharacterized protein n=1 Tax=Paxillus involutus ATCC 200175 TaxID=664439 RepID=A0A0C9SMZ7_PAXIN|nr:hypothetical protein PAXINDRAFT_158549 [Paxillus involutus ATCC 200175]
MLRLILLQLHILSIPSGPRLFHLSPDTYHTPTTQGNLGPKFRAAHSGTVMDETGHLAALFMKIAASLEGKVVKGRTTQPVGVTVAELKHVPPPQMYPQRINAYSPIFASIPITVSIGTCIACAMFDDWFSFAMILLGILTSGISCLVIGSGKFTFTHPDPAKGSPAGDGLLASGTDVVLLKGEEGAEKIQQEILLNNVLGEPKVTKYYFGTRTSMVVFVLLVLQPEDPSKILNELLPNDTKVWRQLKSTVIERLVNKEFDFEAADWDIDGFTHDERTLLETLYGDVHSAYEGYFQYCPSACLIIADIAPQSV